MTALKLIWLITITYRLGKVSVDSIPYSSKKQMVGKKTRWTLVTIKVPMRTLQFR